MPEQGCPAKHGVSKLKYGMKNWLTATLALSASCGSSVTAADLTVTSGNTQVLDGSASFPGGVDVSGGTLVIGGNGGGAGVAIEGNVHAMSNAVIAGFGAVNGDLSVTEVCFAVGCSSLGTFSTRFTELVGVPPSTYREQGHATAGIPSCVAKQVTRPIRNREARVTESQLA